MCLETNIVYYLSNTTIADTIGVSVKFHVQGVKYEVAVCLT